MLGSDHSYGGLWDGHVSVLSAEVAEESELGVYCLSVCLSARSGVQTV